MYTTPSDCLENRRFKNYSNTHYYYVRSEQIKISCTYVKGILFTRLLTSLKNIVFLIQSSQVSLNY